MKLIVDIDDETYKTIKNAEPLKWDCPIESAYKAIKNGTRLEDIKTKIEEKDEYMYDNNGFSVYAIRTDLIFAIIENCIHYGAKMVEPQESEE